MTSRSSAVNYLSRALFFRKLSNTATPSATATAQNLLKSPGGKRFWLRGSLLAAGVGYLYYTYQNFKEAKEKSAFYDISPYKLAIYRTIPLSCMTSFAGKMSSLRVPVWLRQPIYGTYSWVYGCDLSECEPLKTYETFNAFFTRPLRAESRPTDKSCMVSPADGKVLALGRLGDGEELYPEQIKGVKYPLRLFLRSNFAELVERRNRNSGNDLYYCSVYLAPGSYHRFHSPVEGFKVNTVENIPGEVLPVAPWLMRLVPGLVSLNERAVIAGSWRHGYMSMIPVGATNVRSITLKWPRGDSQAVCDSLRKGEEVGRFNMGSLVVLLFEAPKNWEWKVSDGRWVRLGEPLGYVPKSLGWWPF